MSSALQFQILPEELKYEPVYLSAKEKAGVPGMSLNARSALWFILTAIITGASAALGGYLGFSPANGTIVGIFISVVVVSFIVNAISSDIKRGNISKLQDKKSKEAKAGFDSKCSRAESAARTLSNTLNSNYRNSLQLIDGLHQHFEKATSLLKDAEAEFRDNAFSPFWDAVENTAVELADFNSKANALTRNASDYYKVLKDKKHTFPAFPAHTHRVPEAKALAVEFLRIVRLGQTNFQFANIWEHRRTREVLITGFRTLGEAVNNLGASLENSIYSLQESISSDLAGVVEEEIKTRESLDERMLEQNKMLDNIQHRRKPTITDAPQKY